AGADRARPARIPRGGGSGKGSPQIARASAADGGTAADRFGGSAQRNPRTRRDEPGRSDRLADRGRRRARPGRAHRRRPPQPARPICVLVEDPPRPPSRAPDEPLSPPRRNRDRNVWIVAAPLHALERRPRKRDRQQRRYDGGGGGREQLPRRAEMVARAQ